MDKLTFLGDVFVERKCVSEVHDLERYIPNLECVITDRPPVTGGKYNLQASQNYLGETFGNKPELVCLANNHVLDCGQQGLADTCMALEKDQTTYYGAGIAEEDCNNPAYLMCGGKNVAVLGFACESTSPKFATNGKAGVLPIDVESIGSMIRKARESGADRVVVSLHWGAEDVKLPKPSDVFIARQLIDSGVDLIIGHHAHCAQPWEKYNGRYVFYGLGNCIFPDRVASTSEGLTSESRIRRYGRRGRKSWAVDYHPSDNSVRVRELYFNGQILIERRVIDRDPGELFTSLGEYEKRFRRSYFAGKTISAMRNFFLSPKLPRIVHFKALAKFAFPDKYE